MSGARTIPALRLRLRRSRPLLLALAAGHLGAAATLLVALPAAASAAGLLLLGISAAHSIRLHALRLGRRAVHALELEGERTCRLQRANGTIEAFEVQFSSYVSSWLVVLHLHAPGRRRLQYVVLPGDSVPAESMRRLRARLRWMSDSHAAQPQEDARL